MFDTSMRQTDGKSGRAGFTLAEGLLVLGIAAVLAAAAVPSALHLWANANQCHLNRCAETIFLTAQRNLAAAKTLGRVPTQAEVSGPGDADAAIVLPEASVGPSLYAGHWVIEYDGWTVREVRYWEADLPETGADTDGTVGRYGG